MNNIQLRLLILRPDRLGDVVLSTPLPREIKKNYPDTFVVVLVRNYTKDIYTNNPFVNEILIEEELGDSFWQRVKRIRSFSFTHGIALLPTEKNNWLLFFSGIKIRIGVGHKFYQFLSNAKSIYRRKYIPLRNEADYCLDALRKIGIENPDTAVSIYLSDEEKKKVLEIRESFITDKKIFVGIHATSGKSAPNLSLPEYRRLAEQLVQIKNVKVFITEKEIPNELKDIEEDYRKTVESAIKKEIYKCTTLFGPHRDDYDIILNGMSTKIYGSQGQQRTAVLSMKLAEIDIMKEDTGDCPVLLLDDVLSELDNNRQEYLFENIGKIQTFITCTDKSFFRKTDANAKFFNIVNGIVIN